jgi:Tol biopolymer transport system component
MSSGRAALIVSGVAVVVAACGGGSTSALPASQKATRGPCPAAARAAGPAADASPAGPLGQRRVAFSREDGVYVARTDGTGIRRLTRLPEFEYQPDWSPDGRRLLLRVDGETPDDPRGGVHVVDRDGRGARNLSNRLGVRGGSPDWSPDGKQFAFMGMRRGERFPGIYVARADGSGACRVTADTYEAQYPAWSPDGRKIAFSRVEQGGFDLAVVRLDGGGLRRITSDANDDNYPEWSPDGSRLVFNRTEVGGEAGHLWVVSANGSSARRLLRDAGEPSWSPDGEWLAFDCPQGTCAARADGSARRVILRGLNAGFPAWDPLVER